ncbi:MAG: tRNA (adenosine(37)-N6)-threonylcarbamoyltransferase complex dimerization subunit type 1 TsaB [Acidobacteriota bacterium]
MNESPPIAPAKLLALDTGSPVVSVALTLDGKTAAERSVEQARSSVALLELIDECLREAGLSPRDLNGIAVLRGPGSFTGLRVGLATVLGLRAALAIPVAVLPSLEVLAAHAIERAATGTIVGVVDALRGEWFASAFRAAPGTLGEPTAEAKILPVASLASFAPATVCGFGVRGLADRGVLPGGLEVLEASPLAATAARLACNRQEWWDAALLTQPLYLREPAVTLPNPR